MKKLNVIQFTSLIILFFLIGCKNKNKTEDNVIASDSTTVTIDTSLAQATDKVNFHPEYVKSMARIAYIWGYPMVNLFNRRESFRPVPEPGKINGVLPAAPVGYIGMLNDYISPQQNSVACPNQDVVYGYGYFELDKEPVVFQVPDFGDRFWVYAIYDTRTEQLGEMGKMYKTKPGFYLLKGPNWKGKVPDGIIDVIESPTELACAIPRVFMDDSDADRKAIQPVINQISAYPLSAFDGKMKIKVWKDSPNIPGGDTSGGEIKWVDPAKFFNVFLKVLKQVPPLKGEEALYGQFRALMSAAEKNPEIKKMLVDEAIFLDKTLIKDFLKWEHNGVAAGNGWNRSLHNAQWGLDYFNRLGSSRSNIFDNSPKETQYFYTDNDSKGGELKGNSTYTITFPKGQLPPVNGFWSMTLYNKEHFFFPNKLNRYSLGTKNKGLQLGSDGSLTLYVGNKSPGTEKESNWIPAPADDFSLYIRAYWGKEGIINGSWQPPVITKS